MARGREYPVGEADDRALAVWCFNRAWDLMEKPDRSPADDDEMLSVAFASRFHWSRVGTAQNFARSEWQIARVYTVLGRAPEALRHSERCLEITEQAGLRDFDLAFAYEGMARSLALSGRLEEARAFARRASEAAAEVVEEDDRRILMADLATLPVGTSQRGQ